MLSLINLNTMNFLKATFSTIILTLLISIQLSAQFFQPVVPIDWRSLGSEVTGIEDGDKDQVKDEVLNMLPNESVDVVITKIKDNNTVEQTMNSTSEKNTSYIVTMDYMRYKNEQVQGEGEYAGMVKIGIGLRLTARITCKAKGVDLGSLFSIADAVAQGKINGSLNVDVIGIKNKDVTITVPIPGVLNQTSIQNAMQSLATVKSKMYDVDAILHPQILAVKTKEKENSSDNLIGMYKKQIRNDKMYKHNMRLINSQQRLASK